MTRACLALSLVVVCAYFVQPARAGSCSNARPMVPITVVPQPQAQIAPGQVEVLSTDLDRGPNTEGTLCIAVGSLGFQVSAPEDDLTPPGALGYVLEMVEPEEDWWRFEDNLGFDEEPAPLLAEDGWVWFNFFDMPEDPVEWTFRLAAVDTDGNQGEWSQPITVSHPGKDFGGCATGGGGGSPLGSMVLLLLGLGCAVWRGRGQK